MEETPSWLDPTPAAATPVAAPAPAPAATSAATDPLTFSAPTSDADGAAPNASEREEVGSVILFMRVINLLASIAMIVHSVLILMYLPNIEYWVMAAYALCAGCLICCQETQLQFIRTGIAMNFGFLFDPTFRFGFYILMASVQLSFGNLFGKIVAGALMGVAFYNTYVLIKYPAYRKIRDEIAKEEDSRINKKIQERVQSEAQNSVTKAVFGGK